MGLVLVGLLFCFIVDGLVILSGFLGGGAYHGVLVIILLVGVFFL